MTGKGAERAVLDQGTNVLSVWVDSQNLVVSFHYVEGYQQMEFSNRDFFDSYLQSLVLRGYRFM